MTFDFDLGKPFHPFEQLMGVLPAASQSHIPEAFRVRRQLSVVDCLFAQRPADPPFNHKLLSVTQELMTDPGSSILDFYPEEFEADMNGKKQEWEAVVKIPFIDEKRLLQAMKGECGCLILVTMRSCLAGRC